MSGTVDIEVEIEHETERAILVNDGMTKVWLPLSQIIEREEAGGLTFLTLPEWLATAKGLI